MTNKVYGFSTREDWIKARMREIHSQIKGMASSDMDVPIEWMYEIVWLGTLLK